MNKSQTYLTQAIVGGPRQLDMGHKIGSNGGPTLGFVEPEIAPKTVSTIGTENTTSPWVKWLGAAREIKPPKIQIQGVKGLTTKKVRLGAAGVLLLIIGGVLGPWANTWIKEYSAMADKQVTQTPSPAQSTATASPPLPIMAASGPAQSPLGAITVVNEPAAVAQATASATQPVAASSRPIVPVVESTTAKAPIQTAQQVNQQPPPTPLPTSEPKAGPLKLVATPAPRQDSKEEHKPAVILDVAKPVSEEKAVVASQTGASPVNAAPVAKQQFQTPKEVKPPQPPSSVPNSPAKAAEQDQGKTAAKTPASNRITVVDMATDGSYVLLTNPETRLPQKYKVGQKIHTGETIQKIEPKTGKLVLDSRSVYME